MAKRWTLPPLSPTIVTGRSASFVRFARTAGKEIYTGDPTKVAAIIVDVTRMSDPPLRLALGDDAYSAIDAALQQRLGELGRYRELSGSIALAD